MRLQLYLYRVSRNENYTWEDRIGRADNMINKLKMVKNETEIKHLKLASEIAERNDRNKRSIKEGISRDELAIIWKEKYSHSESAH